MTLNHQGTRPIKTERLLLRRFTMDDGQDIFDRWSGSPENTRFVMASPHQSVEDTRQMLQDILGHYGDKDFYMWAIVFQDQLAGYICGNELNEAIKGICIGYCISKPCWNQGIATEAAKAVVQYFFELGFNRVFSYHNPLNPASGMVMQKAGMSFEGRIRGGSRLAGEICDCLQYAILRSDVPS